MKMGAGLFWGIVLIIFGLSIIFSIFRVIFAVVIILFGIRVLIGKPNFFSTHSENQVIFGEKNVQSAPVNNTEYNTIFGKSVYDFRHIDNLSPGRTKLKVNTIFGSTQILLPDTLPVKIKADVVFGSVTMPDGNTMAFGTVNYNSLNAKEIVGPKQKPKTGCRLIIFHFLTSGFLTILLC
jgi:predicted membrane protein